MPEPSSYGWYHLLCIFVVTVATVIICKQFKDCPDKTVRLISLIAWGIILALEIYKQLIFGFGVEDGRLVWDYAWYAFPFQFCSSPLYILPFIVFAKNEKIRGACIFYMITFSLFAGLAVFCYPNDVFVETIGINIQTMVHHGSQILLGVFFAVRYRKELNIKRFFSGFAVFVAMVLVAMILNISMYHILGAFNIDETFNMFYISRHEDSTLPVYSMVHNALMAENRAFYPLCVIIYIVGFTLVAGIMLLIAMGIKKLGSIDFDAQYAEEDEARRIRREEREKRLLALEEKRREEREKERREKKEKQKEKKEKRQEKQAQKKQKRKERAEEREERRDEKRSEEARERRKRKKERKERKKERKEKERKEEKQIKQARKDKKKREREDDRKIEKRLKEIEKREKKEKKEAKKAKEQQKKLLKKQKKLAKKEEKEYKKWVKKQKKNGTYDPDTDPYRR